MRVCGVRRWQLCKAAEAQIHPSIYLSQPEEPDHTSHPLTAETPGGNAHYLCLHKHRCLQKGEILMFNTLAMLQCWLVCIMSIESHFGP